MAPKANPLMNAFKRGSGEAAASPPKKSPKKADSAGAAKRPAAPPAAAGQPADETPEKASEDTPARTDAANQVTPELPAAKRAKASASTSAVPAGEVGETGPYSLWAGSVGPDRKELVSPGFHPELVADVYAPGTPVGFGLLSKALTEIEALKGSGQGSRKKMTVILSNVFRILLYSRPQDLIPTLYILSNKVAPDYEEAELGIGDGVLVKAMGESFGKTAAHINGAIQSGECTDLGEVALASRAAQKVLMMPPKLTIEKVFAEMKGCANSKGKDSQTMKKDKIKKMLVASRDAEAKFIVRMLQAKLRVGIQLPTMLQALAAAFSLSPPRPAKGPGPQALSDVRKEAKPHVVEGKMCSLELAIKQAFSEMPTFDKVVGALLEGHDGDTLSDVCHISLGIPVKPMLAKPSKGISEVTERLGGKRFTGEWKYDGERAQIHVVTREKIFIYSRNSENMTEKYPDVIKFVQETLCDGVESCIIDSELVAYDQTTGKILPFQILSTRGRKNINIDEIKVNVCLFAFDCMLCNGVPLVAADLETRRNKLWEILKETEGKVKFATYMNFDDINEEQIQGFLDESIAGSCEGLMLKTLTNNATYCPSKRSLNWLKLKKDYIDGMGDSIDVVPIGAFYGKGKRTGTYGAFLLAIWNPEDEEYQTVCKAGTGFSDEDLTMHYNFFKEKTLPKKESNYNVSDNMTPQVWLEACQVWEIKAADLSISPVHTSAMGVKADGKGIGLRFPRYLRIRDDKGPEDSTGPDQIVEMFEAQASVSKDDKDDDDDF